MSRNLMHLVNTKPFSPQILDTEKTTMLCVYSPLRMIYHTPVLLLRMFCSWKLTTLFSTTRKSKQGRIDYKGLA